MKLTLQLVAVVLNAPMKFRDNLFKFTDVGVLRTTTTNCRVSFIGLYLVFPRNFRIVFLPHTNTVILLERYCGTITEPGLPVFKQRYIKYRPSISNSASVVQTLYNYKIIINRTLHGHWEI